MSATINYDAPDGVYLDGAMTAAWTRHDGFALIGGAVDAGYVWRTSHDVAIDIGATHQQFTTRYSARRSASYSEIYAGVSNRNLAARVSYSPNYFAPNSHAIYAGIDAVARPAPDWRLIGHVGAIAYLSPIRAPGLRTIEYDYGLSVIRRFEAIELELNLSSGGPDPDYYRGQVHGKTALTVGASVAF